MSTTGTDLSEELTATFERLAEALGAMSRGDPEPYAAMWHSDADVTLFGAWGPIERGHDAVTGTFKWVGSRFSDGTLAPEHHVVASSGDLAYTVGFERGEVCVDGGDPFTMVIRVTHVLRRYDGQWWVVHRHADFPPPDQRLGS